MSTSTLKFPVATKVSFEAQCLKVALSNGECLVVPLVMYPRLNFGTQAERKNFVVVGGGTGIHWPDLDEDISIAGLLAGRGSIESPASILRWLESRKGRSAHASKQSIRRIRLTKAPAGAGVRRTG
jgi:hypothetical protein